MDWRKTEANMTDLTIRTFDATRILPEEILRGLRNRMRGTLALPGEDAYEAARTIWNAMIDRRPAVVAQCMGAADVIKTVKLARDAKLLLAVRGGGHNIAGNAVCDGGLLIDLSLMKSVHVDPASRIARVEPGATLADFERRRKSSVLQRRRASIRRPASQASRSVAASDGPHANSD
jgi:FAD binding domain